MILYIQLFLRCKLAEKLNYGRIKCQNVKLRTWRELEHGKNCWCKNELRPPITTLLLQVKKCTLFSSAFRYLEREATAEHKKERY